VTLPDRLRGRRRAAAGWRAWPSTRSTPDRLPYAPEGLEAKPEVGAEGFFAVDMRTGRVLDVEPFPEARKPAWKLTVDFGPVVGTLRTSAQVTNYTADELRGRIVVGALNLGRKRIAGFTSEFLILGALDPDGTVRLLELPDGVEPGAPIA
jgi:tRNA-binding protein